MERSVLLMIKKEDFPQKNTDFLLHKVESNALLWQSQESIRQMEFQLQYDCSHDNDKIKKKRCGKKEKKKKKNTTQNRKPKDEQNGPHQ